MRMGRAQRFGIRLGRGWTVLLLLAIGFVGTAYWIGPLRPFPAEFELGVLQQGALHTDVGLPGVRTPDGAVQFAMPLGLRNVGARPGSPERITLSVPAQYRVFTRAGMLPVEVSAGVALRRYIMNVRTTPMQPDSAAFRLPGLDTVWLEADLPRYYCTLQGVNVPEFVPAPHYDAATLGHVRLFYSIDDGASDTRNTGLLTVRLPQELLDYTPAPMPPTFRTVIEEPEAQAPELGALVNAGTRTALCGDPQSAIELYTVLWKTTAGGRMYVIYVDGAPRKHLYDLNDDGVVELETWDGDGDSRFESRREARFQVPEFLLPLPPRDPSMLAPDSVPPDSAFLAVFHDVAAGPRRFALQARTDSVRAAADTMVRALAQDTTPVAAPDPAWLQLFHETGAGPFRFTRRPAAPVVPDTAVADTVARDTTPAPRAPQRPRGPRPLGTPVPGYPPPP